MASSFLGLLLDKNRINIIDGVADEYNKLTALVNNELNINNLYLIHIYRLSALNLNNV